jgi:crossover junction endodeoxyribonuclease RuvC
MILMGIDPGIANVGFGVIESSNLSVVISGTLITSPRRTTAHRIYSIAKRIAYLIEATDPDRIVIEEFIPFRNQRKMSTIDKACGAIIYVAMASGAEVVLVRPNVWMRRTLGLTRTARFSKLMIMRRVDKRLGIKTRVEHEAEALGMALYGGRIRI